MAQGVAPEIVVLYTLAQAVGVIIFLFIGAFLMGRYVEIRTRGAWKVTRQVMEIEAKRRGTAPRWRRWRFLVGPISVEQFLEGIMARETITAEDLLRDIYQAESELRWFEQKHTLLSENFYRLYQQGHLRDEDPVEIREYLEWAGWWEIYQDRRERYQRAVEHQLKQLTTPASLDDLHISKLKIPA